MILPEIFLVGPVGFQIRPVGLAILPEFSLHTSPGIRLLQKGDPVLGVSHHQGHGGLLCADSQSSHPRHKPAQHKASVTVPIPAGREVQQAAQGHTATKWPSWDLNPKSLAFEATTWSLCDSPSSCRRWPALLWKAQ